MTEQEPTISDTRVELTTSPISGTSVPRRFDTTAGGLRGGTTYYVRAFAINGNGVAYGEAKILYTPSIFTQESESYYDGGFRVEGSSASFVIAGRGYLLGGDTGPTYVNNLYCYNPALSSRNRWGELERYTAGGMKWISVAVMGTRAYALGGLGIGSNVKDDFYVYNTVDNSWVPRTTGPGPAYSRAGLSLTNEIVYGGGMNNMALNEVWAYDVYYHTWMQKSNFPVSQYGGIALTIDNEVYAGLGKNTSGVGNKQLWKSSGALTNWTPEPSGSELSGNVVAGTVFNNKIYVIDKSSLTHSSRYTLFEYDPASREWRRKSELPSYSWDIQFMYSIMDRIYIGFANSDKVVLYNPYWDN
jgi:hypothetical protein